LPIGKALVAVEGHGCTGCTGCYFDKFFNDEDINTFCYPMPCGKTERKDGKDVIFKLVDYEKDIK
jgi:hypothetical protein